MTHIRGHIAVAVLFAGIAVTAFAPAISKGPRFAPLTMEQLNDQQRPLGEQIMKVSSVGLGGPYNAMLRSPVLGQRMFDLLYYLRWNTSVPLRLNEFAILITGRLWRSQVEWFAHAPLAIKAGLSPQIIADLKANKRPADMQADEAAVYDFMGELRRTRRVSNPTYAAAHKILGDQGVIDLVALSGYYDMVSMTLNTAQVRPPEPGPLPLPPRTR